jgi:hypothetical protein
MAALTKDVEGYRLVRWVQGWFRQAGNRRTSSQREVIERETFVGELPHESGHLCVNVHGKLRFVSLSSKYIAHPLPFGNVKG